MQDEILKRITPPSKSAVALTDAKLDCRVDHNHEDALIQSKIDTAVDYLEAPSGLLGKAFITQEWEMLCREPDEDDRIYIPVTPIKSVDSITCFDSDNEQRTLDVEDFHLYGDENWAYITPKEGVDWPRLANRLDAITIGFTAGFGDNEEDVPERIRQLIRLIVVHWYTNRSAVTTGTIATQLPMAAQSLIAINRKGWTY